MIKHNPNKNGYNAYECALKEDFIPNQILYTQPKIPPPNRIIPIKNNLNVIIFSVYVF